MQNEQRRAALGISERHSVHGRVSESGSGTPAARRAAITLSGLTTKKKIAAATETNAISALMKSP